MCGSVITQPSPCEAVLVTLPSLCEANVTTLPSRLALGVVQGVVGDITPHPGQTVVRCHEERGEGVQHLRGLEQGNLAENSRSLRGMLASMIACSAYAHLLLW